MAQLIDRQEVIKHIESCIDKNGYVDTTKFSDSMRNIFSMSYKTEKQIKADVIDGIDEIIQLIKDNSFDHKLEYDSFKAIGSSWVIYLLEQLKEQI